MAESGASREVLAAGFRLVRRSWRLRPAAHALATLGAVIYALASVGFSQLLGEVADRVVIPQLSGQDISNRTMWLTLGALAMVGTVRACGAMGRRWFQSLAEYGTQKFWREQLMDQFVYLPLSYHRRVPAGHLLAHADTDLERSTRMLKPLAFATGTIALAVASLVALWLIHPFMALVALVLFPLLAVLNRYFTDRVSKPAQQERVDNGVVASITHESFDGALVVKTLGREQDEVDRLAAAADALRQSRVAVGRLRAVFDPIIEALPNVGVVALVAIGAWLVDRGETTIGGLITAVSLFTILAVPVRIVGFLLQEIPGSVAGLSRVDAVIAEPRRSVEHHIGVAPAEGPVAVELRGVSFAYDAEPVLHDVSFAVSAGESLAIVGSTGSGKSTIMHLIAGLAPADSGEVRVGGDDPSLLAAGARAERVLPVFQEAFLFASSIRENITLGVDLTEAHVAAAVSNAAAEAFVSELPHGVDTVVGERGITLSGGQRQRIALARALAREPSVVLLDDATSALDPAVERDVLDRLRTELSATLIMVAYRLATIELADRVVYLVNGHVAATGTHVELMQRADYAALVRAYEESAA